jgi:hypothetical protein
MRDICFSATSSTDNFALSHSGSNNGVPGGTAVSTYLRMTRLNPFLFRTLVNDAFNMEIIASDVMKTHELERIRKEAFMT